MGRESNTPEFLQNNPNGMVPVLVDGKTVLWEASAIMIYLCEKSGGTPLWPEGALRYEVLKWMFWAAEHFRQAGPVYFEENFVAPLMGNSPDGARLGYAEKSLRKFAGVLEQQLSARSFLTGEAPTLADLDAAAPLSQITRSGIPYGEYPNIMAWNTRLGQAIPAWADTGAQLNHLLDQLS